MKLASIRIVTNDLPRLTEFYQHVTGAEPGRPFGGDDYVELQISGVVLALVTQQGVDAYNPGAASAASNRSVILEFQVDDVDSERGRLASTVTDWVLEPTSQPWGYRSMLFRDPDGNVINLYAIPPV